MTLDDFIKKYQGKFVEYHSYNVNALNQCTDLANQYITEVLGLPAIIGTNAQDFPSKRGDNYDWIVNTPKGLPEKGDLMIFKSADGVGHISIFIEGNLSLFKSFDQNYPTGSPCQIVQHNYRNVLGWMHPKGTMATMYKGLDLNNQESMKVAVDVWDEVINKKLYVKADDYNKLLEAIPATDLDNAKAVLGGIRGRITELENKLGTAQANEKIMSDQVSGLITKVQLVTQERDLAIDHSKIHEAGEQEALKKAADLEIKLAQLQNQYETLKQAQANGEITLTIADLFKMLWNQKITIKK